MSVELEERWGRTLDDSTLMRQYLVRGEHSVFDIRAEVQASLPFFMDGSKERQDPSIDELDGGELFYVTVIWKMPTYSHLAVNEEEFWFDTGGGPVTITQSLEAQVNYVATGETAINYGGAIRLTDDGPQGVEYPRPNLTLGVTRIFPRSSITNSFIGLLTSLTGTVNNASFRGLAAGECMLTNVAGRHRNADETALSLRFAGQPNEIIDIGEITGIEVDGWDHVDVYYNKKPDGGFIIHVPRQVVVSRPARRRDFSLLGIST